MSADYSFDQSYGEQQGFGQNRLSPQSQPFLPGSRGSSAQTIQDQPQAAPRTGIQPIAAANQPNYANQPGQAQSPYAGYGVGPPAYGAISSNPLQPNPSNIAGLAPANVQQFGGTPQVNPTYADAASINPANAQSYLNQAELTTMGALNPLFQQQQQGLAQSLAARGITNSGSAQQLQNDLYSQQAGQYANAISPMISQGFGYAQQDVTGNAANQQAVNMANAGASNEANILNAGYYGQDRNANATAYNNYMNELLGLGSGQLNAIESAYLNSYGPSTGVESAYGNALSGMQSIYGNVYGSAMGQQTQQMNDIGLALAAGG